MTELSFLINLLLNHKLQKQTKEAIKVRISEVEQNISIPSAPKTEQPKPALVAMQALSTQQILEKNPDIIAQTPAAAQALKSREEAIQAAMSGKIEKGQTHPRKF